MTTKNPRWIEKPLGVNIKVVFALFTSREYSALTSTMALTDLKMVHKVLPTLQRSVALACNELDSVQNLPPGLEMMFCQVEHEVTHAIGVAALLCRRNELISEDQFDVVGTQISVRTHELFASTLTQRSNSVATTQPQLGDNRPDEAGRFYTAFNSTFVQAADLSVHDPESNTEQLPLRILPAAIEKPAAKSGKILEFVCTAKRTQKGSAQISILNKRGQYEVQFDDGPDAYVLELVKRLGVSVKLKVAAVSFPGAPHLKQKYRLLEVLGVEPGPWHDIASCYTLAAQILAECPAITAEVVSLDVTSTDFTRHADTDGAPSKPASTRNEHQNSLRRRNRKIRNPL